MGLQQLEYCELNVNVSVSSEVKLRRLIVLLPPSVAMVLLGRLLSSGRSHSEPLSVRFCNCEECLQIDMLAAKIGL